MVEVSSEEIQDLGGFCYCMVCLIGHSSSIWYLNTVTQSRFVDSVTKCWGQFFSSNAHNFALADIEV